MRHGGVELCALNYFYSSIFFAPIWLVLESEEEMRQDAEEQQRHLASEILKCSSNVSPVEDSFGFFYLYVAVVSEGNGIQPCLYIRRRCVCVWVGGGLVCACARECALKGTCSC